MESRCRRVTKLLAAPVVLAAVLAGVSPAAGFTVTGVSARAEKPDYWGFCPVTVRLYGTISVDGPGTVTYCWQFQNHSACTEESVVFDSAGSKTLVKDLPVGTTEPLRLRIVQPKAPTMQYAQTSFNVRCKNMKPMPDLTIPSLTVGSWGACYGNQRCVNLKAVLKNIGNADFPTDDEKYDYINILLWGTLVGPQLKFPRQTMHIPANGGEITVDLPVSLYLMQSLAADHGKADSETADIQAVVDPLNWTQELIETNNVSPIVAVPIKRLSEKLRPNGPGGKDFKAPARDKAAPPPRATIPLTVPRPKPQPALPAAQTAPGTVNAH